MPREKRSTLLVTKSLPKRLRNMVVAVQTPPLQLPTIILDALLCPGRFAAVARDAHRTTPWMVLLLFELILVVGGVLLLLSLFIPIDGRAGIVGAGVAFSLAILAALPTFMSLPMGYPALARLVLSFVRALITVGAPAAVGLTLLFSRAFSDLQQRAFVVLLLLLLMGIWAAGSLTFALLVSPRRSEVAALRWLSAGGALLITLLIAWSEPLRQHGASLLIPLLTGFGFGLMRPLSFLWQAPLSLLLALLARLGGPTRPLCPMHPVGFDELCLIPLPGLAPLLVHACREDIAQGGPWLLQVAAHPAQAWAARHALEQLVRSGHGHATLLWLSSDREGVAWLQQLVAESPRYGWHHPQSDGAQQFSAYSLIRAYAMFTTVNQPAAWPTLIAAHRDALWAAIHQPGGAAVATLVTTASTILSADRWPIAITALQGIELPDPLPPDPLWLALEAMHAWSLQPLPTPLAAYTVALHSLHDDLPSLEGWPAALLDAVAEQLFYLLSLEQRRGRWFA